MVATRLMEGHRSPTPAGSWLKRPSRRTSCIGETGIPRPRDKRPKIAFRPETVSAETETQPQKPANCGLLGRLREISRLERMRGGPGRIRTSNQIVMCCAGPKPR
jgi:hypothetical protein